MPSWLVEDPTVVYLILGIAGVGLAVGWWLNRQRRYLVGLGIVVALVGVIWLLNYTVVTDSKRIILNLQEMAEGVKAHDSNRVFAYIASDFHSPRGLDRAQFREIVEAYIRSVRVRAIDMWDFQTSDVSRQTRQGTVRFSVKVKGNVDGSEDPLADCEAIFHLENDQWKLSSFKVYWPQTTRDVDLPF